MIKDNEINVATRPTVTITAGILFDQKVLTTGAFTTHIPNMCRLISKYLFN